MSQRDITQHEREESRRRRRYSHKDDVRAGLKASSTAIERGQPRDYRDAIAALTDVVVPALESLSGLPVVGYSNRLADDERYSVRPLRVLTAEPERLQTRVGAAGADGRDARSTVEAAQAALAAIAESEGVVQQSYERRVPATGLQVRLGDHLQDGEMDLGDEVQAVSLQAGTLKSLFVGGTGQGKSAGLEREAEDFFQAGQAEGRDYKVIDLVDLGTGENWFYDIPQQQSDLRRIREEEFGLPPDFTDAEDYSMPDVEVLVPLTPGLAGEELPYDTDRESFTVRPFTVPAADLRKQILIPCIMSRLSDKQEQTVRQAYDDVDREHTDWSLRDLADEIRSRDELEPRHKADAIGVLRSLQDLGFIRTRECDYTIDWRDVFTTTDTITIFSQALIPDSDHIGKMMCVAYLVDKILELRRQWAGLPEAAVLMRELWEIVPHNRRNSSDERAAAIQDAIATVMARVFRRNRHVGLHLLGDTQKPNDLHIATREMFNRYVVYSATENATEKIFEWTMNDKHGAFMSTLNINRGQAGVIGQVQPAIDNRDIEFLSPVEYAPPAHHHFDKDHDSTGWRARCKYLTPTTECPDCGDSDLDRSEDGSEVFCPACEQSHVDASLGRTEELRQPVGIDGVDWPDSVPDELQIHGTDRGEEIDVEMRPVAAFADECIEVTGEDGDWLFKADVRAVFNEFLEKHDREPWDFDERSNQTAFGSRFQKVFDDGDIPGDGQRQRKTVYTRLTLSREGNDLRNQLGGPEVESTAAPIQGE